MTIFHDRQKKFEKKFEHDQNLLFKTTNRCIRMIGKWTTEHLELTEQEAKEYVYNLVQLQLDKPGKHNVIQKIHTDFTMKNIEMSMHRIEKEYDRLFNIAHEQIKNE